MKTIKDKQLLMAADFAGYPLKEEIKAYLEKKGATGSPYVILDDTADFCKDQQSHFIQINPQTGITEEDAKKAIRILSI